ncbi:hypothetical protein HPP92_005712 [Vanilla planifolia]|uniref:Uncharacterized protein n=1 Tax=Vanilla planifolia TaxID=51239 RepID=A0A835RNC9_VANPL|nr:hypothetical protein HPP92_005712 [Vanilla planifolia]
MAKVCVMAICYAEMAAEHCRDPTCKDMLISGFMVILPERAALFGSHSRRLMLKFLIAKHLPHCQHHHQMHHFPCKWD